MISLYSKLSDLYNALASGKYRPTAWVEIADLTLGIYELLEKEPTELNALYAGGCMASLITIASGLDSMPIGLPEILSEKLSHILANFEHLFSDEQYRLLYNMWQRELKLAEQNRKKIKESDIGQSVAVLRRVVHDDWHKDFFEIIFPDVKDIPMDGHITPRNGDPIQQVAPEASKISPNGPGAHSSKSSRQPPQGPKTQTQLGAEPPRDDNSGRVEEGSKGKYVDILNLILIALIRSVMQGVKPINGGVQMSIKPDVLQRTFDIYRFGYGLKSFLPGIWVIYDYATLGGIDMSGISYVCQILELFGCKPQVGPGDTIIVRGEDAKKLQNINDYQYLYKMWLSMTDIEKEALSSISSRLGGNIPDKTYTAYQAYAYWQAIGDYPKFAMHMMNNGMDK